jgi:sugar-specific transcriptional regulator TrmB
MVSYYGGPDSGEGLPNGAGKPDIFNLFKIFGFTESDVKVYLALIRYGNCTGYEASKLSGVPRSKVYNVLKKLVLRGIMAITEDDEKTNRYRAESIDQVIALLKNTFDDDLDILGEEIRRMEKPRPDERTWRLQNYDSIRNKCVELIGQSVDELLIQIWIDDLDERLEQAILEKQAQIKRVLVVLYDSKRQYRTRLRNYYRHGFEKDKLADAGCRWLTIVSDKTEMIYSTIFSRDTAEAVFTRNHSMVFFANEYILHDAYCLRLIEKIGARVKDTFGEDMEGIRDVFSVQY